MKEIPNLVEQNKVREYCNNHELVRPDTNILKVLIFVLLIEAANSVLYYGIHYLSTMFGISLSFLFLYLFSSVVVLSIFFKKLCILFIELYQHYASEKTRRRCTLMPSCSEYSKLALKKYGLILGLYKTYIRLFKKCGVDLYKIDYP